ncbi:polyphosphate polymerase domain-containing protein [Nocardioides sp.]|uniref:polyphosphate polymerase domain-containing protein n=1 Tax=Nocardioides sp. TaxID=35761 RepID=UPI002F3F84A8
MSVAREPTADTLAWSSPTAAAVTTMVQTLPAVDLATLESAAGLLTRVDRKYIVTLATLERLVQGLGEEWRALDIDGRRLFGYTSTYFDTDDLVTYRAHLQRRRKRYKVRVRRYTESEQCMLEIKRKGLRGVTVKERQPHPAWQQAELGDDAQRFVTDTLGAYIAQPTSALRPVVVITNRRATLASLTSRSRLTIDTDLTCGWGERILTLRSGHVVLETKVEDHASTVDRMLRSLGERPAPISKYCVGVASLGLDVPHNPWGRTISRYFDNPPT